MDRFDALLAFARVVEAGSFTKAAQTLHLSKTTVTQLVQQLEARLLPDHVAQDPPEQPDVVVERVGRRHRTRGHRPILPWSPGRPSGRVGSSSVFVFGASLVFEVVMEPAEQSAVLE